ENDFESPEHLHTDMPRETLTDRRAFEEKICQWSLDHLISDAKFRHATQLRLRVAADTAPAAVPGVTRGFHKPVRLYKIAAQTKAAVAAGVDFESPDNRRRIGAQDCRFDAWRVVSQFHRDHFAFTRIVKRVRFVQ